MKTSDIIASLKDRYPCEPTFLQAAEELLESVGGYLESNDATEADCRLIERMLIPERVVSFRVTWADDDGVLQHNTGYRVQFNSALGPYKGGLRFDPSVNLDVLKFLGFEQIFKNALTGLPLGGGKGGSDFNPKGKSDNEIRSFCIAFMTELYRYIGPHTDVPAGDIGVGAREIGYLYGVYKNLAARTEGVLTGKGVTYGGSKGRTEATGFGAVYFAGHMLKTTGETLQGKTAVVSGSGNVATHAALKLVEEGAVVRTLSDRGGFLDKAEGLTASDIETVMAEKATGKALSEIQINGAEYTDGKPWQQVAAELYFPCATQNELEKEDAEALVDHGALLVAEGANMPTTTEAVEVLRKAKVLFGPGKAVNAGGVAVSGLEMAQNAVHTSWTREEVDTRLQEIMESIHEQCVEYGTQDDGSVDYVQGANVAGFVRVEKAMRALGW